MLFYYLIEIKQNCVCVSIDLKSEMSGMYLASFFLCAIECSEAFDERRMRIVPG